MLLSVKVELEKVYWGRDCIDSTKIDVGCRQDLFNGTEIQVCVCKEEGCNKEMGEIPTTSTAPTTTHEGTHSLHFIFTKKSTNNFKMLP